MVALIQSVLPITLLPNRERGNLLHRSGGNNPVLVDTNDQRKKRLGARGEEIARHYLKHHGYDIEQCNWRSGRMGEVDVIVLDHQKKTRVFVEVKTRKGFSHGTPLEAVTSTKQRNLYQLAEIYMQQQYAQATGHNYDLRMDVLGILFPGHNKPAIIEHIQNAF
jgi:putative endonuclease